MIIHRANTSKYFNPDPVPGSSTTRPTEQASDRTQTYVRYVSVKSVIAENPRFRPHSGCARPTDNRPIRSGRRPPTADRPAVADRMYRIATRPASRRAARPPAGYRRRAAEIFHAARVARPTGRKISLWACAPVPCAPARDRATTKGPRATDRLLVRTPARGHRGRHLIFFRQSAHTARKYRRPKILYRPRVLFTSLLRCMLC